MSNDSGSIRCDVFFLQPRQGNMLNGYSYERRPASQGAAYQDTRIDGDGGGQVLDR